MSFSIILKNDGSTATIRVYQQINDTESAELHNGTVEFNDVVILHALKTDRYGDDGGDFAWEHEASGATE